MGKNSFYKNKSDIIAWLDKYDIINYKLITSEKHGFVVDVKGDVDLHDNKLTNIPVKFNFVDGSFDCSKNNLSSLNFCPDIITGDFYCFGNKLKSLELFPKGIGGKNFIANNNLKLTDVDMSEEYDYAEIYKIHVKHKILAEKEKLSTSLIVREELLNRKKLKKI